MTVTGIITGNTSAVSENEISMRWMEQIFPKKSAEKRQSWLDILQKNEFDTFEDLQHLDDWSSLALPLAIEMALKAALKSASADAEIQSNPIPEAAIAAPAPEPLTQLDCIVMDVSASMRARSTIDPDKTREDVSKLLFHTMVDKLVSLELSHAVGILAFGQNLTPVAMTREYERFHDELGRLDANQGRTRLWDAVYQAALMLCDYSAAHPAAPGDPPRALRVFCLTDGEDNCSGKAPWQVAQFLQQRGVTLDAIPVAGANRTLQAVAAASGGQCFEVVSQEQGVGPRQVHRAHICIVLYCNRFDHFVIDAIG